MECNKYCDSSGKIQKSSEPENTLFNFNNFSEKDGSQCHQHNGITLFDIKNTEIAQFSVVTPEQSKFIKPVDTPILSLIPEADPDLTIYLSELLKINKPEQQSNKFWFPTPKFPGNSDDHTPIQTRILKEMHDLKEKKN